MIETKPWADTLEELSPKRAEKPSKRWRNRYRVVGAVIINRPIWGEGDHWGTYTFPSAELAEQAALEWLGAFDPKYEAWKHVFWLGAFPVEDETP